MNDVFKVNQTVPYDFRKRNVLQSRNPGPVVKALDSQSRGPVFKTTGWLQGQLSLSSLQGR